MQSAARGAESRSIHAPIDASLLSDSRAFRKAARVRYSPPAAPGSEPLRQPSAAPLATHESSGACAAAMAMPARGRGEGELATANAESSRSRFFVAVGRRPAPRCMLLLVLALSSPQDGLGTVGSGERAYAVASHLEPRAAAAVRAPWCDSRCPIYVRLAGASSLSRGLGGGRLNAEPARGYLKGLQQQQLEWVSSTQQQHVMRDP